MLSNRRSVQALSSPTQDSKEVQKPEGVAEREVSIASNSSRTGSTSSGESSNAGNVHRVPPSVVVQQPRGPYLLDTIDRPAVKKGASMEQKGARPSAVPVVSPAVVSPPSAANSSAGYDNPATAETAAADTVDEAYLPRGDSQSVKDTSRPGRSGKNRRSNSDIPLSVQSFDPSLFAYNVGSSYHGGQPQLPPGYPYQYGPFPPSYNSPFGPQQQPYPQQHHQPQQQQQQPQQLYNFQQQQSQHYPPHHHIPHHHQQYAAGALHQQPYTPRMMQPPPPPPPVPHGSGGGSSKGPPRLPTSSRERPVPPPMQEQRSGGGGGETRPLLAPGGSKSERRLLGSAGGVEHFARQREYRDGHRRSLSSPSAEGGGYGAFWSGGGGAPSQQQQQDDLQLLPSSQRHPSSRAARNRQKFSPRAEFRKLARGLSPTSPTERKTAAALSSRGVVSWSPPLPPFFSNNGGSVVDPRIAPYSPLQSGEASSYYHQQRAQGTPSTRHHKTESLRKMHERQQSAQLFVEDVKGVEQPLACRNVIFLLLFVFHLLLVIYLVQIFGMKAFRYHGDRSEEVTIIYSSVVYIACWSGLFAVLVSALLLGAMTYFARHFVQIALFAVIALSFVWGTIGIGVSPKTAVPVTGIIALALAVAYAFIVWDRIPFATANLVTALSGIRAFPGIIVVALGFQALALVWSICFSIVVFSVYDAMQEHGKLELSRRMTYAVYVLLALSFNWSFQVLQGTVQAITAAVIGGWWHEGRTQENAGLVRESCFKTIFYSMGSICFGSLFVGPVRLLRLLSVLFRPSSTESSLMCLHECVHFVQSCMTSCVDAIAAGFNAWAFTYIGMYHYGFLEAGHNATDLFDRRGWSMIVSDDLIPNVLFLTSLVIGGITGCFAHFLSQIDGLAVVNPKDETGLAPFVVGVIIGLVLSSVVFSLISSSVNAVLVCFASSPLDFERHHPELSHEMRSAWREVWPRALDVCDERLAMALNPEYPSQFPIRAASPFADYPVV